METVIVAFENEKFSRQVSELLESSGAASCLTCSSGDQVRRLLGRQAVYCVVCGPHLADGPAEWLAEDLPPECSMLLVGSKHQLDARGEVNIFKMPTPIRREEMLITVRLMLQFGRRVEKLMRPARSAMEQQLVDRAKQALMARFDISEEEAHRRLQKRSMDSGRKLSQTARRVLAEREE